MAKDTGLDLETDDVIDNDPLDSGSGKSGNDSPETPKRFDSVREAIEDAREQAAKSSDRERDLADEETDKAQLKKVEPKKTVKAEPKAKELSDDEEKSKKSSQIADKADSDDKEIEPVSKDQSANKPPVGWSKAAKDQWNSLPDEIKKSVAKREDEVSNGFKEYGERARQLKEYDDVVERLTPDFQQFGVTKPQLVERTLLWLNSLRNPSKQQAIGSLKQLAASFGLEKELQASYSSNTIPAPASDETQNNSQSDPSIQHQNDAVNQLQSRLDQMEERGAQSERQRAQAIVDDWKKDKPHFDKVRASMHAMLKSGMIPLKASGDYDLDQAYTRAVRSDPELYEQVRSEELDKHKEKLAAETKAERERIRKENDVARSKRANVSLKPNAPVTVDEGKGGKQKSLSVREAIELARKEVRGT